MTRSDTRRFAEESESPTDAESDVFSRALARVLNSRALSGVARLFHLNRFFGLQEIGVVIAAIVILVVFIFTAPSFLSERSVSAILNAATEYGIVSVGVTLLLVAGEFDLSVGVVFALCPLVAGDLVASHGMSAWLGFLIGEFVALAVGLVNGVLTLKLKVPSFIVTLGTYYLLTGVTLNLTGGYPVSYFGSSRLFGVLGGSDIGSSGISVSLFWWIAVILVGGVILTRTKFGNYVFASGADAHAARSMGVPVGRTKLLCFIGAAAAAGLTGLTQFASLGSVQPAQGGDLQLTALVVAVVGGASLLGGRGSVAGSALGALIIGGSYTGLVEAGLSATWFESFIGVVLLLAVVTTLGTERMRGRWGGVLR